MTDQDKALQEAKRVMARMLATPPKPHALRGEEKSAKTNKRLQSSLVPVEKPKS